MRWLLVAAAALVAALLLFLLRDEEPQRRETRARDVPLPKKDYWRKQRELHGEDGRAPTSAKHVTLAIERDRHQPYKHTWPRGMVMDTLPFTVWEAGAYSLLVVTASHDPARLLSIRVSETGPRRVRPLAAKEAARALS